MSNKREVSFRIRRQNGPGETPYWQDFKLLLSPGHNVVSALMVLRDICCNSDGQHIEPVAWEYNCMEEVCGACAMTINGVPQPSCSALTDNLSHPITLEPLSGFPVVRDLMVDRSAIFNGLLRTKAWIEIDGPFDTHHQAPIISHNEWEKSYPFSRCMSCGVCMAGCPQFNQKSGFVGAAILGQVDLMNRHPTGKNDRAARLHAIMDKGGISDCGNAQNCVRLCPKKIPLSEAISRLGRASSSQLLSDLFG